MGCQSEGPRAVSREAAIRPCPGRPARYTRGRGLSSPRGRTCYDRRASRPNTVHRSVAQAKRGRSRSLRTRWSSNDTRRLTAEVGATTCNSPDPSPGTSAGLGAEADGRTTVARPDRAGHGRLPPARDRRGDLPRAGGGRRRRRVHPLAGLRSRLRLGRPRGRAGAPARRVADAWCPGRGLGGRPGRSRPRRNGCWTR